MTTTPNPTTESVIAEAMVNAGAPLMHSRVEESVAAALRANGLLSEGAPREKQARAIRKLDNVQAIFAGAQASVTDAVRELSLTSAALEAAVVAPQEPNQNETKSGNNFVSLDPEKVAAIIWDLVDVSPERQDLLASALCEAYKEGKLT